MDALRLSMDDRLQLRRIVKAARGKQIPVVEPPSFDVRPTVRMLLDRLEPTPAVVINRVTDVLSPCSELSPVTPEAFAHPGEPSGRGLRTESLETCLAHTAGFARLMAPTGLLDRTPANLVRFALTDPRARSVYQDWASIADARVATLGLAPHLADPHINRVDTFSTAKEFTDKRTTSPWR